MMYGILGCGLSLDAVHRRTRTGASLGSHWPQTGADHEPDRNGHWLPRPRIFVNALWMLFLARIIDGISGANISTAQAVITDSTTEKTRTQGLGLIGGGLRIGLHHRADHLIRLRRWLSAETTMPGPRFPRGGILTGIDPAHLPSGWRRPIPPNAAPRWRRMELSAMASRLCAVRGDAQPWNVGILLSLMFAQQLAFGGFELLLALFTLNRLGMNARDNSGLVRVCGRAGRGGAGILRRQVESAAR